MHYRQEIASNNIEIIIWDTQWKNDSKYIYVLKPEMFLVYPINSAGLIFRREGFIRLQHS